MNCTRERRTKNECCFLSEDELGFDVRCGGVTAVGERQPAPRKTGREALSSTVGFRAKSGWRPTTSHTPSASKVKLLERTRSCVNGVCRGKS